MPYTADEVEKVMAEPGILQAEEDSQAALRLWVYPGGALQLRQCLVWTQLHSSHWPVRPKQFRTLT